MDLGRYIDALTLILLFIFYKRDINSTVFVSLYTVFTGIMLYLIFAGYFPVCYIEGVGLTVFKKISEYFVSSIFLISAYFVYKGSFFTKNIRIFFFFHLFFLALSELFFTFYVSVYGISNVFGHLFAFLSVSVLFYILIKEGIMKPYNLIFNELITTKNKVEQLNKTSQAIYSIIKHDLTNRITSMIGFLELYKLERNDKYCDNLKENLNIASIELENLTALINQDFVASSYSINLKKEIDKLKKQFKTEFIIEGNCCAKANRTLISVVYNVISNAIKHGKATKIFIQIFSRNKNCVLKISNNGLKIEDEIVQLLFKETFQKENHTSVGLLISRKLLYQLNGTIDLVTNEEGNVTFEIKVPQCNENT